MILSTPSKSCELNPIPTSLLKQILPSTSEIINIINISLRDGVFPESLKKAPIKPLLKKVNLDLLDRNFRLISNLGYVSKLSEHAAATHPVDHIKSHGLMENNQSAYCTFHSTETTLLKVKMDVIRALENQEWHVLSLIFLQLSIPLIMTYYSAEWKPGLLSLVSLWTGSGHIQLTEPRL